MRLSLAINQLELEDIERYPLEMFKTESKVKESVEINFPELEDQTIYLANHHKSGWTLVFTGSVMQILKELEIKTCGPGAPVETITERPCLRCGKPCETTTKRRRCHRCKQIVMESGASIDEYAFGGNGRVR